MDQALTKLPGKYAAALCLDANGLTPAQIAEALEVEPEAVGPLLALADAKLAAITADMERLAGQAQGQPREISVRSNGSP